MGWTPKQIEDAWTHLRRNWGEVRTSNECVCIQCRAYFHPNAIVEWLHESYLGSETRPSSNSSEALCPYCAGYYVLGDASGLPLHDVSFLQAMLTDANR